MRNFQKKLTLKFILRSKPFLIFLSTILLIFAWNVFGFWNKMQETVKNRKLVEYKISALEQQKEKFSLDIEKLKTERGIEESIRDKFGLVKDGEDLIVVVDEKPSLEANASTGSGGFFSFLKNLFK